MLSSLVHVQDVINQELLLPSLNHVHEYLWWCPAQPAPALALHEQIMAQRTISVTEKVDLHLVCPSWRILIKPLPPFLLNYDFWIEYLCQDGELHRCGLGLLLSYIWLVRHQSDLAVRISIFYPRA
jgi:hypothetical protein